MLPVYLFLAMLKPVVVRRGPQSAGPALFRNRLPARALPVHLVRRDVLGDHGARVLNAGVG